MEYSGMILSFLGLMFIVCGTIIFGLHRTLVSSTEGAVKRLNDEIAKANAKQAELSKKLKQADEDLAKRQAEAKELAQKMRSDAEEESKGERDKIVKKARMEGEEIIAKAQGAKEKLRKDLENEFDVKVVHFGMKIINFILSEKGKGALDEILVNDFLENLKDIDMSRIGSEVTSVDLTTLTAVDEQKKKQFSEVLNEKLNRQITINNTVDPELGGGAIIKFGSMALDGSIKNLIREAGVVLQEEVENG